MKKYLIATFFASLLLTGCFKSEDELFQQWTDSGDVTVYLTVLSTTLSVSDIENSVVTFSIDSVDGDIDKLQTRVYFKGNNTSAILEEIALADLPIELTYTVPEMAEAVTYPVDSIAALDVFTIDVLTTVNGVVSTQRNSAFNASVIFEDEIAGIWDIQAVSYGSPGDGDELWSSVLVQPDPAGGYTVVGIAGSATPIILEADLEAKTVSIANGQDIGDVYGYGAINVIFGDGSINAPIVGTINDDGSLSIDNWGHLFSDGPYAGSLWDVFNTTWTR